MVLVKQLTAVGLVASTVVAGPVSAAPDPAALGDIENQLTSAYHTAKATADGTDIVTAGSVLVLQKDHLVMTKTDQMAVIPNVYKGGALSQNGVRGAFSALSAISKWGRFIPGVGAAAGVAGSASEAAVQTGANASAASRDFVTGEKFWVTQITTKADGVSFALLSDSIAGQRYKGTLQFPFAKGAVPTANDVVALVGEVVKVDAPEQTASNSPAPPPAPEPKTVAVGQTRDEVIANFGVPTKILRPGAGREIDIFPDMRVTFVHDKVSNVE